MANPTSKGNVLTRNETRGYLPLIHLRRLLHWPSKVENPLERRLVIIVEEGG